MSQFIPMTREAYDRKIAEVRRLESEVMPQIADKIAAARAEGDLRENAEYHAQREEQGMLQARINKIKSELANASIVDPSKLPKDEVCFGSTVRVMDLDLDEEESFTLVGAGDEDYDSGKIQITSPVGRGLVGAKVDETVEIKLPKGVARFKILEIRFE